MRPETMEKELTDRITICIMAESGHPTLEDCLRYAGNVSDQVLLACSGEIPDAGTAQTLGVPCIAVSDLSEAAAHDWVLLLKPSERVRPVSRRDWNSILDSSPGKAVGVCVRDPDVSATLNRFVFMESLGQNRRLGHNGALMRIEPRLTMKSAAAEYARRLADSAAAPYDAVAHSLVLEPIAPAVLPKEMDPDEHDLLCLQNRIGYGSSRADKIDELNSGYIGFRVIYPELLESYPEIAERGWGSPLMCAPMLEFLNNNGRYAEARRLFEEWLRGTSNPENAKMQAVGGVIYANLFLFDEAIACYEKALRLAPGPELLGYIGRLYFLKGDRETATRYLADALAARPSEHIRTILRLIRDNEGAAPQTLSVCIPARDEETVIGRAVRSVRDIADEIIVADAGSVDRTKAVAESLGCRVISIPWKDDFSAVRNACLAEAKGDYIFMLDADEYIHNRDRLSLAFLKKILPPSRDAAFRLRIVEDTGPEKASQTLLNAFLKQERIIRPTRIFPNLPGIAYSGRVFESVEESLASASVAVFNMPLFPITELNDRSGSRSVRKTAAVEKLFSETDDPNVLLEGALYWLRRNEFDRTFEWLMKAGEIPADIAGKTALLYIELGRTAEAKAIAGMAGQTPGTPELQFALGRIHFLEGSYAAACETWSRLADGTEVPQDMQADAFYYYGLSLLETGRLQEGVDCIAKALELAPLSTRYQTAGLLGFALCDRWELFLEAAALLMKREEISCGIRVESFVDVAEIVLLLLERFAKSSDTDEVETCHKALSHIARVKITDENRRRELAELLNRYSRPASMRGEVKHGIGNF